MTALSTLDRAAPSRGGREPAAGAVAADGLGHLAPAPLRTDRRGVLLGARRLCMWIVGLQLHHAYAAATRLPPGGLSMPACQLID